MDVTVHDITGKVVYRKVIPVINGYSALKLDVRNGIYFIQIVNMDTHESTINKVVVNRN